MDQGEGRIRKERFPNGRGRGKIGIDGAGGFFTCKVEVRMKLAVLVLSLVLSVPAMAADPKPIAAVVGDEFKITLESNPSTGNQWLIAKPLDAQLLKLLGSDFKRGRPGTPGGGGHEILSFKALGEGRTQIHLKYGRLWEQDVAPARTTNFTVVITRTARAR